MDSKLSVEYILTDSDNNDASPIYYHAILMYDSNSPAFAEFFYFSDGDGGASETVGVQGFDANHNAQAVVYGYNAPNTMATGNRVNFVTNLNANPNGTATLRSFQASCYGPGTWPKGTCL